MKKSLSHRSRQRLSAESIAFTIASCIVAAIVGLILFIWMTQNSQPPVISVTMEESIRQEQGKYYVPFTVTNAGGGTAESVQVIGELRVNDEVEEYGEQQIDFLSSNEKEEGAFVFSRDPDQGELLIRVASYKLP